VRWAAEKGINEADPRYTTLGSLLEPVLTDVGADVAAPAVAVIVRHDLYRARDVCDDLIARYQVPDFRPSIPDGLAQAADRAESLALQSAGRRTPLLLDVDSLATGILRAASVCRVETGDQIAIGTGFAEYARAC
jgi:hypothetical protein